ncbi:MAG: PadR family transcriptional regulator [Ktedonobacterales bacterium]
MNHLPASASEPEELLPLTPAVFHILLALVPQERHGYSIMREVDAYTQGKLHLGTTTLYRSIKQMLAAHLIEEAEERPDPELDDERRRYYRLTSFGQQVLRAESARLAALVSLAWAKGVLAADRFPNIPGVSLGGTL